jgi:hypothetical protein
MYKLCKNFDGTLANCVILNGITAIPFDPANTDYQAYLAVACRGQHTIEPAEEQQ